MVYTTVFFILFFSFNNYNTSNHGLSSETECTVLYVLLLKEGKVDKLEDRYCDYENETDDVHTATEKLRIQAALRVVVRNC